MLFTLVIGLILLVLLWDYFNTKHRKDVLKRSKIGGHRSWPLIGTALEMRGINSENAIEYLRSSLEEGGKIYHSWILHKLIIFSADAKDLEEILSSQTLIEKNDVYDMLAMWLGDGLLRSSGKKWHTRRKIITPTFHFKILEQFVEVFDQQSNILVDKLKDKADGSTVVDIFPLICLMALDIIAETAMGVKVEAQTNPELNYVKSVKTVTSIIAERLRRPTWRFDWSFLAVSPKNYTLMLDNIREMHAFTHNVIKERRDTLEQTLKEQATEKAPEHNPDTEDDIGGKKRMALLDVLLQATVEGKPLSDQDISEEVETFMFGGHDTTTSATSFILYAISRHPEVQQKVFEEIREVLGDDKNRPITYKELQDLKYMDCVIKEAMRLYPPVPIIGRYISEDVKINNRIIPGNTHLNMMLFVVLRDPDYFKDPDQFKPERFFNENQADILPFAYVPFSAGPRNCIGQKYGMLEMKSTISKILRHYELLPLGPEVVLSLSIILRSTTGVNFGLKPRIYK